MRVLLAASALLLVTVTCGAQSASPPPSAPAAAEPAAPAPVEPQPSEPAAPVPPTAAEAPEAEPASTTLLQPTPAFPLGEFYPAESERPSDGDADLLLLVGSPVIATGEPLLLERQRLDLAAQAVADVAIELWQADAQGNYLGGDDTSSERDPYFQSYGQATSDSAGSWSSRTLVPGPHDGQPRQLHVRVTLDERELLVTRLFFAGDPALDAGAAADLGEDLNAVVIAPEPFTDEVGFALQRASHILIVDAA